MKLISLMILVTLCLKTQARPLIFEKDNQLTQCIKEATSQYYGVSSAVLSCIKEFAFDSNFKQCTRLAKKAYIVTSKDNGKALCYEEFKYQISFKDCTWNASKMTDVGLAEDSMRDTCFEDFKYQITFSECIENARKMTDMALAEDTMRDKCFEHFKHEITLKECKKNARGYFTHHYITRAMNKCRKLFRDR